MDIEQFRKAGYQAIDRICEHNYTMGQKPVVSAVKPGYLREALPSEPPQKGEDFQNVADDYQRFIVPGLTNWQHPSFFAWFPTSSTFESIIAGMYVTSASNPAFNWSCSPACTELENVVTDWAAKLLGLTPEFYNTSQVGGGVLQPTASDSALVALVAARSRYLQENPSLRVEDLMIYCTTQTHSSAQKAGLVLGISVNAVPVYAKDNFGIKGDALKQAIEEDFKNGKKPIAFFGTIGTTSSGAIDNLDEVGEIVQQYPLMWLHIDSAWAGSFLSCPEYREKYQLAAINKYANSLVVNFHKSGLAAISCSVLWVRNRRNLTDVLDITPTFLRTEEAYAGTVVDYRNWGLGLGREFRSLKFWFVLRSYGVEGFQKYLRKLVKLNGYFVDLVKAESNMFEIVTPPSLSLTVFRIKSDYVTSEKNLNDLNKLFYRKINSRADIMLTQTDLNGLYCTRFVVGAQRTEKEHIDNAFAIFQEVAENSIQEWKEVNVRST